jgi:hypothetical protein
VAGATGNDWEATAHAQDMMAERGITADQVSTLLAHPQTTAPDPKGRPNCRYYTGHGMLAVVDEAERKVITVGIMGANRHDWRTFAAPQSGAMPEPVTVVGPNLYPAMMRRRRKEERAAEVRAMNVLDGVHPLIADGVRRELARLGLDFRSVRVDSPTEVSIIRRKAG